jgi:hypothetical protein
MNGEMIAVTRTLLGPPSAARRAVTGLCWVALGVMLVSAPAQCQDARRGPDLQGDGIGIYVDGQLACWLGLDAGRRRGSVSFSLTNDGRSCSIESQPRRAPRRQVALRVSPRTAKCFIFDGRQFCE